MANTLRIGIMGARRGSSFAYCVNQLAGAEFTALCETDPEAIEVTRPYMPPETKLYTDFDEFIHSGLDAVILCNYFDEHAKYAIKAFEAGVHVLSETTAAPTLGECVELVEACEKYGMKYMLAVNCMYFPAVHAMKMRVDRGETGDILYGEAEYIHGSATPKNIYADRDPNDLHRRQFLPSNMYNMHTLAPLMYVTGSMPKTVSCTIIQNDRMCRERGKLTDTLGSVVVTRMDNGAVFNTTGCSAYTPTSKWYRLACEKETLETVRYDGSEAKLIVATSGECQELTEPTREEAGLTVEGVDQEIISKAGHGGIDLHAAYHFIKYLRDEEEPFFDVYRSVAVSAVAILGWYSALTGSGEIRIPDFRDKAQRDEVRGDYRKPFARRVEDVNMPYRIDQKERFTR